MNPYLGDYVAQLFLAIADVIRRIFRRRKRDDKFPTVI